MLHLTTIWATLFHGDLKGFQNAILLILEVLYDVNSFSAYFK